MIESAGSSASQVVEPAHLGHGHNDFYFFDVGGARPGDAIVVSARQHGKSSAQIGGLTFERILPTRN
jgi:hypothetical protein